MQGNCVQEMNREKNAWEHMEGTVRRELRGTLAQMSASKSSSLARCGRESQMRVSRLNTSG